MKFSNMQTINQIVDTVPVPRMFRVSQQFHAPKLSTQEILDCLHDDLHIPDIKARIVPGMSVAITAGSRMIANYPLILRTLVEFVREQGGNPFIVPSMGSHGGATAQGQKDMLATLGVTEESIGCPIHSSMETVCIGKNSDDMDVHIDRFAYEADGIIVCNRIKPHNGFRGQYESGLFKMMAVGLGKQRGAEAVHSSGGAGRAIPLFARVILEKANILFGVGIMENAYDETAEIHVIKSEDIPTQEPIYLQKAFTYMPKILVNTSDVLIVEKIGKNYSGGGMDSNITGRFGNPIFKGFHNTIRIGVLDISDKSHGNANGIGQADIICKRAFDKWDPSTSYPNALTTGAYHNAKIPMVMMNDRLTIQACIKGCRGIDKQNPRLVYIKNTLQLNEIWLSEAYWKEVQTNNAFVIESCLTEIYFDETGNISRLP